MPLSARWFIKLRLSLFIYVAFRLRGGHFRLYSTTDGSVQVTLIRIMVAGRVLFVEHVRRSAIVFELRVRWLLGLLKASNEKMLLGDGSIRHARARAPPIFRSDRL